MKKALKDFFSAHCRKRREEADARYFGTDHFTGGAYRDKASDEFYQKSADENESG